MISVFRTYFCIQINKVTILNNSAYNSLFYTGRAAERNLQKTDNPSSTSQIKKKKKKICVTSQRKEISNVKPVQWRVTKMLGTGAHDVQGMAGGADLGHSRK